MSSNYYGGIAGDLADSGDDTCCGCGGPMPESVMDWWIARGGQFFCSESCIPAGAS